MPTASELTLNTGATALDMANTMFGAGITVTSASYSGDALSSGIYSNGDITSPGVFSSGDGVLLSTGHVADFTNGSGQVNQASNTTTNTGGLDNNAVLNAAAGVQTLDGALFEAEFIPTGNLLTLQLVFSSEEYLEWVGDGFNDTASIRVNGQQVMFLGGTGAISAGNINQTENASAFIDNTGDLVNTEMDGLTHTLTIQAPVQAGQSNTISIGIADALDAQLDSNLAIIGGSVQSTNMNFTTHTGGAGSDTLTGDNGADSIVGGNSADELRAARGEDTILGGGGNDNIWGDGGDDIILGGRGNDTLRGGRESDLIHGGDGNDSIVGQRHGDTLTGGSGDDTLKGGGGGDSIAGGDGDDFIKGGTYQDTLDGGAGNDILTGNRHDDILNGGAGHDTINAGGDDDTINGGSGNDWLKGGAGADVFEFQFGDGHDEIVDFNTAHDSLVFTGLSAQDLQLADTAQGLLISYGSDSILLEDGQGLTLSDLDITYSV